MTGAEYSASDLRDLRGPSALGGAPARFRRLLWRMTRTDLAVRYHNSVLGYLWTLLEPLLLFAVLYLAFTRILRFGGDIPVLRKPAAVQHHAHHAVHAGVDRSDHVAGLARGDHAEGAVPEAPDPDVDPGHEPDHVLLQPR